MSADAQPPATMMFKAHPWHGIPIGEKQPVIVNAYIEIVPSDTVKFELDKSTGHLKVDRPQAFSNVCPTLYGIIPQTLCGPRVAQRCHERSNRREIVGDDDPMDVCIFSEKVFPRGDVLLRAIPVGGFRMIDSNQADDKIVAVMVNDATYGQWTDIGDCPKSLIDRLRHYFLTYKTPPDGSRPRVEIAEVYGREEALTMITRSYLDYLERFGDLLAER